MYVGGGSGQVDSMGRRVMYNPGPPYMMPNGGGPMRGGGGGYPIPGAGMFLLYFYTYIFLCII
jgi:hypothetical protein